MMNDYGTMNSSLNSHQVEIYTDNLFIQGNILGPFSRTADLLNRRDYDHFLVQNVSLASLGQPGSPRPIGHPLFVARAHIHMVAVVTTPENASDPMLSGPLTSGSLDTGALPTTQPGGLMGRLAKPMANENLALRVARPCYAFTSSFVISGLCHLMEGATIEQLLDAQNTFFHLTHVTAYLTGRASSAWQRNLVLINKNLIQAIYTGELPAQPPQADAPRT